MSCKGILNAVCIQHSSEVSLHTCTNEMGRCQRFLESWIRMLNVIFIILRSPSVNVRLHWCSLFVCSKYYRIQKNLWSIWLSVRFFFIFHKCWNIINWNISVIVWYSSIIFNMQWNAYFRSNCLRLLFANLISFVHFTQYKVYTFNT
jgi:hypothetical protein